MKDEQWSRRETDRDGMWITSVWCALIRRSHRVSGRGKEKEQERCFCKLPNYKHTVIQHRPPLHSLHRDRSGAIFIEKASTLCLPHNQVEHRTPERARDAENHCTDTLSLKKYSLISSDQRSLKVTAHLSSQQDTWFEELFISTNSSLWLHTHCFYKTLSKNLHYYLYLHLHCFIFWWKSWYTTIQKFGSVWLFFFLRN